MATFEVSESPAIVGHCPLVSNRGNLRWGVWIAKGRRIEWGHPQPAGIAAAGSGSLQGFGNCPAQVWESEAFSVSILHCYQVLGLQPGSTLRSVHRAYKQIVLKHHPDRTGSDSASLAIFVEATEAYATLKRAYATREASKNAGVCPKCEKFAPLLRGIGRRHYCAECLLVKRRKFLPMPTYAQAKCLGVIGVQGAAAYLIVSSISMRSMPHGIAAVGLAFVGMAVLAYEYWTADLIDS
ncbi:MAG: hypothetical protein B6D36_07770 [Planctomycetes bacterium UTPLA1]|nr:MAG: hypothetical protein B6D36_07770 [Planctomycetes bacterium UTPLA1]